MFPITKRRATVAVAVLVFAAGLLVWPRLQLTYAMHRAQAALEQAEPARAIDWLKKAARTMADRAEVHYWLGVAYRRAGKVNEALASFQRAGNLGWPAIELRRQRVLAQFQAGNQRQVESEIWQMLDESPSDGIATEIYEALAMGYMADLRFKEALMCLNYWIDWRPDSIEARRLRADAFAIVGETATQESDLRHILALEPARLETGIRLGQLLMDKHQIDAARAEFSHCHRLHPDDQQALLGMAHCEFRLGHFDEAGRHANDALTMAVTDAQRAFAKLILGQIAIENKQYPRAIELLQEATRLQPNEPNGHYNLAIALAKSGQSERGEESMRRYQRLDELTTRLGDLGDAVLRSPNNPEVRYEAGMTLLELGDSHAATRWLLSAAAADSTLVKAHRALAELYREQGKTDLARHHQALADAP